VLRQAPCPVLVARPLKPTVVSTELKVERAYSGKAVQQRA
jgi:hypothetical protein